MQYLTTENRGGGLRDATLDLIRIVAISLVVLQHSVNYGGTILLGTISYLCVPGAPLFFMVSGALLLDNEMPTKEFLSKRLTKVLFPTLIWTAFYLIVSWLKSPVSLGEALRQVLSIPFEPQGTGVLWFMYVLVGLYLLTPILSRWLERAATKEIALYLSLWLIAMCYPWLKKVLDISLDEGSPFYYFAGYVGYYVSGYFIAKREFTLPLMFLVPLMLMVVAMPFIMKLSGMTLIFDDFYYTGIYSAMYTVLLFMILRHVRIGSTKTLTTISSLVFGVYLVHIFIAREVLWKITTPSMLSVVIIPIVVFAASLAVSWCFAKSPVGKWVVGVRV